MIASAENIHRPRLCHFSHWEKGYVPSVPTFPRGENLPAWESGPAALDCGGAGSGGSGAAGGV